MSYIQLHEVPEGWEIIPDNERAFFESELANELCPEHMLFRQKANALARKKDRDDFLFQTNELKFKFCVVHLTWSKETDPNWPSTTQFEDKEEFLKSWKEKLYE